MPPLCRNRVRTVRAASGFTLLELLAALVLGALLVTAGASAAASFSQTVARLQTESVDTYDSVLARMTRDVRYAWWVETPAADRLQVSDEQGRLTEYSRVGDSLLVRRPSGHQGALVSGLSSVGFDPQRLLRLRERRGHSVTRTIWSLAPTPTISGGMNLASHETISFFVMGHSDGGPSAVDGVRDQVLEIEPTSFSLPIARAGATGTLDVKIVPAFGPGYAYPRPGGTALASFSVDMAGLPAAVVLVPPVLGNWAGGVYAHPGRMTSLAIPAGVKLQPGVAYAVTLMPRAGVLVVGADANLGGPRLDIMTRTAAGAWHGSPGAVSYVLTGTAFVTNTEGASVVGQVRMRLQTTSGIERVGSAGVLSQVLAENPWLGVLPGEEPGP